MTPADVLLKLVSVGAVLWVEDGRLRYRAPAGAVDEPLKGAAMRARGAIIALVRAGAVLSATRSTWDADNAHDFEERVGFMVFEGGLDPATAEREAERLVRLAFTRAFIERGALLASGEPAALPRSVVNPDAAAVATARPGSGPHRRP